MSNTHIVAGMISVATMLLGIGVVCGQNYPTKPVRVVTSETGGSSDFTARLIAQGVSANLGQQMIVDNRGLVAAEIVAKAQPDGYTLLFYGSPMWLSPFIRSKTPWDPIRSFSPITLAVSTPNALVVHPTLPVKTVKELIALAKTKPGQLNYATNNPGSNVHLGAELFKSMAGVDIMGIPYKGSGPALAALVGGETHLMFPNVGSATPHIKAGRIRVLGIASDQPSAQLPGVPTVAAAGGLPGYEAVTRLGIFAPAKTSAALITRLNQEIVRFLNTPAAKEKFFGIATDVIASPPAQLTAAMTSEMTVMGKLIKDLGIHE